MVDGEHYPPVVASALTELASGADEVLAAVLVGGREKLPAGGVGAYGDVPVRSGGDPRALLDTAILELDPDEIIDLSDEPVLDYRRRHELISIALYRGVPYRGMDFRFTPPPRPRLSERPSLAIIGTGKRTGKTAVAGYAARTLNAAGINPVVVAMGRGGPDEPEVLHGDEIDLTPTDLLALADQGRHAASDYIEDAMLARVPTVGCRRCGGGLAGGIGISNVPRGIEVANTIPADLTILEGSGASIPPAHADVTGLVVPASIPEEYLAGYLGPYRMLLADFVVVSMCEYPFGTPSQISQVARRIQESFRPARRSGGSREAIRVVRTVFRPAPTLPVQGMAVFVATTAPEAAGESISRHLEEEHGCKVVGISHSLSDRERLEADIQTIGKGGADTLLCEIKAAAIDVATRRALDLGMEVIYMDNVPVGIDGDDPESVITWAAELARERYEKEEG
ncbi:MAG: 2,3-diphosphoglycerate synthetase [Actinobacteria bacterium]|nr:2,3-diphosphoglycerate synthetase [Actinomycetota bacterium]